MAYKFHTIEESKEDYLIIHWEYISKSVIMEWIRPPSSVELREGLEKGLEIVKKHQATRWLADLRKIGALSTADQTWSNEDWFPRALAEGIKRMALIVTGSTLTKIGVRNIMTRIPEADLTQRYFDDIDQARDWLKAQ